MKKVLTLVIVYTNEQILLGMKKQGFGAGRWNGFGGKVLAGEAIEQAAVRELQEEAGIIAHDLRSRGKLLFTFADNNEEHEVHLFSVSDFAGVITESEEMLPQWFSHSDIPFDEMWTDDRYWLPQILAGKNVSAKIDFDSPGSQTILKKYIQEYV